MKKKYMSPQASSIQILSEGMLAGSVDMSIGGSGSTTIDDETSVLSGQRGGWNSTDWSGEE
ncbi:MAG: hypothetical protein PUF26_07085 [Bacteroidales bacterium]|nr:hypothetical protein [Bacteroidales bacterium]